MTTRQIRFVASAFADAVHAGAFGSHNQRHRLCLAWVLACAPVDVERRVRRDAIRELVFRTAMSAAPRPLAKARELVAPAQELPSTSSADSGIASSEPATLLNPAADRRPVHRRAS